MHDKYVEPGGATAGNQGPALRCLVFVGSAVSGTSLEDLERLLSLTQAEARRSDLTGAILFDELNACGCFEGAAAGVERGYAAVCGFSKFVGMTIIMDERAGPQRAFHEWTVAIAQATKSKRLAESTTRWRRVVATARHTSPTPAGVEVLIRFWRRSTRLSR